MSRSIEIEKRFRDVELADTRGLQFKEFPRIEGDERHVSCQLVFAGVSVQVGDVQSFQVVREVIARQKSLPQRVPISEADETRFSIGQAELMLHAALGAFGQVVCKL